MQRQLNSVVKYLWQLNSVIGSRVRNIIVHPFTDCNSHQFVDQYLSTQLSNIMLECSRQPIGVSNIMAIDESDEAYNHVVRVVLDAAINSPIDLLLRADNCTSIARLRQLIKIPGLHERSELFRLNEDHEKDLQVIGSYINWAHNAGHSDITTRTRGSFNHFFENVHLKTGSRHFYVRYSTYVRSFTVE